MYNTRFFLLFAFILFWREKITKRIEIIEPYCYYFCEKLSSIEIEEDSQIQMIVKKKKSIYSFINY